MTLFTIIDTPRSRKPSSWRHPGGTVSETEETDFSECEAEERGEERADGGEAGGADTDGEAAERRCVDTWQYLHSIYTIYTIYTI